MQFRDKLKVDLPAWHHSDSTNSAVAVGKLLGLQCLRCVVHVLAIAAQMVLWEQFKTERKQKISLGQSAEVQAVEKCRNWALYLYKREDRITEFHRIQKAKGLSGGVPKPDSHAKWGSCTTMLRNVCDTFGVWEHFQLTDGECPPPLTTDELILLQGIANCVEIVWASVCKLQKNSALLADYAPITKVLRDELASQKTQIAMDFIKELDAAEGRNLKGPLGKDWALVV